MDDWRSLSDAAKARLRWRLLARSNQLTPAGDWNVWLILAGRGWGKTRTGAEDMAVYAQSNPNSRNAVVARTFDDARDVCIEGESGLLACLPSSTVVNWNRSLGQLTLHNGARFDTYTADKPDSLRGPQHHRAWCDELAAWEHPEAWDQLMFGLRLGDRPQAVVTTTPKPTKLIKSLLERPDVAVTRGSTFENAANLAPSALAQLRDRYEGTRLGRQELNAEVLEDVEGALWYMAQIDALRVAEAPSLERIVVAVDPAVTSNEDSDETGIVTVGLGTDGHAYVLADDSLRASPDDWGRRAVMAYYVRQADRLVAEVNHGHDLVEHLIRTIDPNIAYKKLHASRGKQIRAEPVAALYEQGRVHHVGPLEELEDQLCSWTPLVARSPDRLDALVWALTELMLERQPSFLGSA